MLKEYYGTKKITAKPMTRKAYNDYRGWELPEDENGDDEGYLVVYDNDQKNTPDYDGYVSWSPSKVFDDAYQPTDSLSFGHAILAAKSGLKIARSGWNGKNMYIYHVPEAGRRLAHLSMRTVQETFVPWLASQSDMLADDWYTV